MGSSSPVESRSSSKRRRVSDLTRYPDSQGNLIPRRPNSADTIRYAISARVVYPSTPKCSRSRRRRLLVGLQFCLDIALADGLALKEPASVQVQLNLIAEAIPYCHSEAVESLFEGQWDMWPAFPAVNGIAATKTQHRSLLAIIFSHVEHYRPLCHVMAEYVLAEDGKFLPTGILSVVISAFCFDLFCVCWVYLYRILRSQPGDCQFREICRNVNSRVRYSGGSDSV